MSRDALLLINLQETLVAASSGPQRAVSLGGVLAPIALLIEAAREAGHAIIWLTSGAGEGAATLRAEFALLCGPMDLRWHVSATDAARLPPDERAWPGDVTRVVVCGAGAERGVRAVALEALERGVEVSVLVDAVASARAGDQRSALRALSAVGCTVCSHVVVLTRWRAVRRNLGAGDTQVIYGALPPALDAAAFDAVYSELAWQQMYHRGGLVPRRVALQGDVEADGASPLYRHPADEQPTLEPWTWTVRALRDQCAALLGLWLNHALIQLYEGGEDYISPHADKTLDIARGTAIVGLSLGATRTITLRAKRASADGAHHTEQLDLAHGSLFVLGWDTNQRFLHGIKQDRRAEIERTPDMLRQRGRRISLTMRSVATWLTTDGELFGQGARSKLRDAPALPAYAAHEDAARMLAAFAQENQRDDFDWEGCYGEGFDVLDLASLREEA